jgi:tetratricopeptide (TPR) repeat protein
MRQVVSSLMGFILLPCLTSTAGAQSAEAVAPPLPALLVTVLSPAAAVKPADQHLGALVSVLLEAAALENPKINVVTFGAQAEMLDDLGQSLSAGVDDKLAARLARLSGASHVLYGSFAPAKNTHEWTVMLLSPGQPKPRALVKVRGTPAEALAKVADAVAKETGTGPLKLPAVPASAKEQVGYVRCQAYSAVALERAGVKGRVVEVPPGVRASCEDAGAASPSPLGRGVNLSVRLLGGDAAARAELEKHVDAHPLDRLPLLALVRDMYQAGQRNAALVLLHTVLADRPRDPDVWRMMGELHMDLKQYDKARDAFTHAVAEVPASAYLQYRLSYATYRSERPQQALAHARRALELAGGDAAFYQLNLAERLIDSAQLDEAVTLLKASTAQTPTKLTSRVRLGYVHLLQKNLEGALQELKAAEQLTPSDKEVDRGIPTLLLADLARVHALRGEKDLAVKYLDKLKEAGAMDAVDLDSWDFTSLRQEPDFRRLKGK